MESIEYVKSIVDGIINKFPNTKVRYEFDNFSKSHILEIIPSEFYKLDEVFMSFEYEITNSFIEKYPFECLGFVTSDSSYIIENVIYEKTGNEFYVLPTFISFTDVFHDFVKPSAPSFKRTFKLENNNIIIIPEISFEKEIVNQGEEYLLAA